MRTVINLPRFAVSNWSGEAPENTAWISISEPNILSTVVFNPHLKNLSRLDLSFWDLTQTIQHEGEILHPPSATVGSAIVDFLLNHRDRNIIVNCAAGISRSGAVAQFCQDHLGYYWLPQGKQRAVPNHVLYNHMVDHYRALTFEEQRGPMPLETALDKALKKT